MKGISPIIAAVLLIALTVTIAVILNAWAGGYTSSAQSSVSNRTGELSSCSGAAIEIETVYVRGTGNATAVVKNTGIADNLQTAKRV